MTRTPTATIAATGRLAKDTFVMVLLLLESLCDVPRPDGVALCAYARVPLGSKRGPARPFAKAQLAV
jgi:hypothetical protein